MDTVDFMGFENHGRNRRFQHAAQAQPLVAHGGDMVGIGLDEDDVVAGPHQMHADDGADRAGADNGERLALHHPRPFANGTSGRPRREAPAKAWVCPHGAWPRTALPKTVTRFILP